MPSPVVCGSTSKQAFWEIPIMASNNVYAVHKTLGANIYVWGCRAAMEQ